MAMLGPARASVALATGFLLLGLTLGQITGFSSASGVSITLLSSVFSFVGGALLSLVGSQAPGAASPRWSFDAARTGIALAGFSLGLFIGTPTGVFQRCNVRFQSFLQGSAVTASPCRERTLGEPSTGPTRPDAPAVDAPETQASATQRTLSLTPTASLQGERQPSPCERADAELQRAVGKEQLPADGLRLGLAQLVGLCRLPERCFGEYEQLDQAFRVEPRSPSDLRERLELFSSRCLQDTPRDAPREAP